MTQKLPLFGYLASEGFEETLEKEIEVAHKYGRLFLSPTSPSKVFFAQNIWYEPFLAEFASISEGANSLKKIQRNWALYPYLFHRRAALIEKSLPYLSKKKLNFMQPLPKLPLGSWTLIDEKTILASSKCSSLFPNGELYFHETKIPPSRAYLKLWEAFTLLQKAPKKDEICLELGASPGSWTYVLASLGAKVYAIDKAPLAPTIEKFPNVYFQKGNGFALKSKDFSKIDWFFSDMICYPEKLYEFILPWLDICNNFICTIKLKAAMDRKVIESFAKIEGSKVLHLFHNKNELTWIRLK